MHHTLRLGRVAEVLAAAVVGGAVALGGAAVVGKLGGDTTIVRAETPQSAPALLQQSARKSINAIYRGSAPGVVHIELVRGAHLKISIMAKGGGCENRSKYTMLTPAAGLPAVKDFIIECVKTAGPDACPPLILGVGIGGTFEKAALLSKKALFRELGSPNPDAMLDGLEHELLDKANRLGIGPQGYGGDTTSLGIHILSYPCHITSLPVAVTIECHAHRHKEVTL